MEDPYEDSVIIVDPDSSTATTHDPDYIAPNSKVLTDPPSGCYKGFVFCDFPCLPRQQGSCSTAHQPVELSEKILQNLFNNHLTADSVQDL